MQVSWNRSSSRKLWANPDCQMPVLQFLRSHAGACAISFREGEFILFADKWLLKEVENHAHSVALFAMYYNFVRVHKTLRVTPAMAANVTKRLWEMSDIVDVLEAWEAI